MSTPIAASLALLSLLGTAGAQAAPTYLNGTNITVSVGPGTSPGSFNNTFANGATIAKVIDAPSAAAEEFHTQATHIWFTADQAGGGLELLFDFGTAYDIGTLHFWNYTSEDYDVDHIAFSFFNQANALVGTLEVTPALGSSPGIRAQDILLAAPLNVRYVTAFVSGSNRQVDFQNIGFTADVSAPIPEPGTVGLMAAGLLGLLSHRRWRRGAHR
ncbi:PEP-CTERM sorting domain-containing protein [Aquincola sp. MAHUQ-54]|uniref:PEP-CTERM sorting domain-containing protein n=1 Tax=Aquincola agrisoli TaxID=3119538 RepID=A0AAW9Q9J4_9BURK